MGADPRAYTRPRFPCPFIKHLLPSSLPPHVQSFMNHNGSAQASLQIRSGQSDSPVTSTFCFLLSSLDFAIQFYISTCDYGFDIWIREKNFGISSPPILYFTLLNCSVMICVQKLLCCMRKINACICMQLKVYSIIPLE